jgi:hypothetical protein
MSLDVLKQLFVQGLAYSKKQTGYYYDANEPLCEAQTKLVLASRNYEEFARAVQIYNYTRQFGFIQGPDLCPSSIFHFTDFQFGTGLHERYTLSGSTDTYGFVFNVSRNAIAPPSIVKAMNLELANNVIWFLNGGFGEKGIPEWHSLPFEYLKDGHYEKWPNNTFYLDATGTDQINTMKFVSPEPMHFELDILVEKTHHIRATFVAKAPPQLIPSEVIINQHNKECYTYPLMSVEISIDDKPAETGNAFIRHDLYIPPIGVPFVAATRQIQKILPITNARNMRLFLQFQDQQFFIAVLITDPFENGQLLNTPYAVRSYSYAHTTDLLSSSCSISVNTTVTLNEIAYPTELLIKLGTESLTCTGRFSEGLCRSAFHQASFYAPLIVQDTHFTLGTGLITIDNALSSKKWSEWTFGPENAEVGLSLLVDQPRIPFAKRQLARILLVLPYALVTSIIAMLIVLVFILSFRVLSH